MHPREKERCRNGSNYLLIRGEEGGGTVLVLGVSGGGVLRYRREAVTPCIRGRRRGPQWQQRSVHLHGGRGGWMSSSSRVVAVVVVVVGVIRETEGREAVTP